VLRHGREALVEHILERVVVGADDEAAAPKVGPPMANGLYKADEFALVRGDLDVAGGERLAVERDGARPLM
jgi:hypothetical protein